MTNKCSSLKPLQETYSAIEACVWIVASLAMDAEKGLEHANDSSIVADFDELKELRDAAVLAMNGNPRVVQAARRASIDLGTESPRSGLIVSASALELGSSIALSVLVGMDEYGDRLPKDPWKAGGTPAEFAERCKAAVTGARLGSTRKYERLIAKMQREHELAKDYFGKADDADPEPKGWGFHSGGYSFHGTPVSLEGKLLRLLKVLVEAPGPVRIDAIRALAWGPLGFPEKSTIQTHLSRLRGHLQRRWRLGSKSVIIAVDPGPDLAYRFDHATFNGLARR